MSDLKQLALLGMGIGAAGLLPVVLWFIHEFVMANRECDEQEADHD